MTTDSAHAVTAAPCGTVLGLMTPGWNRSDVDSVSCAQLTVLAAQILTKEESGIDQPNFLCTTMVVIRPGLESNVVSYSLNNKVFFSVSKNLKSMKKIIKKIKNLYLDFYSKWYRSTWQVGDILSGHDFPAQADFILLDEGNDRLTQQFRYYGQVPEISNVRDPASNQNKPLSLANLTSGGSE